MAAADMRARRPRRTLSPRSLCLSRAAFCAFSSAVRGGFLPCAAPQQPAFLFVSLLLFSMRACFFSSAARSFSAFSLGFEPFAPLCARLGAGPAEAVRREIVVPVCQIVDLTGSSSARKARRKLLLALGQTDLVCRAVRVLYPRVLSMRPLACVSSMMPISVFEMRKPGTVKCQRSSVSSTQPFSLKA